MSSTPSSSSSSTTSSPPGVHDIIAEELQHFSKGNSSVTFSGQQLCNLAIQINKGVQKCPHHKRALKKLANEVSEIVYLVIRTFIEIDVNPTSQTNRADWGTQLRNRAKDLHALLEEINGFIEGQSRRFRLFGILLRDSKRIKRYSRALYQSIALFDFPSPDVIQGCAFLAVIHSSRGRHAEFPVQDPSNQLSINGFMNALISQASKSIQDDGEGLQHPNPQAPEA
ncbi:hypothetical protein Moror_14586 [Moniliophthora roreri MCA 2997]|uniref:Uncharacterized protein n=2 Tax=Moniliophthora roreri TaxID=221103 RepID=V2YNK0_MONRO|nr:hypothetical protein Moror_14586 [Moniliophthora roreri MCA 2997]KAI3607088.1 hypothetical protein WG66_007895 [Moniliophthora roreri]